MDGPRDLLEDSALETNRKLRKRAKARAFQLSLGILTSINLTEPRKDT